MTKQSQTKILLDNLEEIAKASRMAGHDAPLPEPDDRTPWWVWSLITITLALSSIGISVWLAIELWRLPWAAMFGWVETHRALSIVTMTAIVSGYGIWRGLK